MAKGKIAPLGIHLFLGQTNTRPQNQMSEKSAIKNYPLSKQKQYFRHTNCVSTSSSLSALGIHLEENSANG